MNNILKKVSVIAMSAFMCVSFAACNGSSSGNGVKPENPISPVDPGGDVSGVHEINVTEGVLDLVKGGRSDYEILLPEGAGMEEQTAANEIGNFISLSTGATIPVVYDDEFSYTSSSKVISIGQTTALEAVGAKIDYDQLGRAGYRIFNKDNSVFLVGGGDFGNLYSAYEFLEHEIGFEVYAEDEIYYEKYDNLKLNNFDVTDVPDFTYRMTNYGMTRNNNTFANRLRLNQESKSGNIWIYVDETAWHNSFSYLPKSTYQAENPKWYSVDGTQLCYNARGDSRAFDKMFDTFMEKFIECVEAYPDADNITITQQDVNTWCTCDACEADRDKYGTNAATMVRFCNKVSDAWEQHCKDEGIERKINICFFAYHKTEEAPVIKNEEGEYEPIDDSVICRDNVYVFFAPIYAGYTCSFYDSYNQGVAESMEGWSVLSDKIYCWFYSTNFQNYLAPYNSFNSMQENYKFAKSYHAEYMFDQGQHNQGNATGFGNLKQYLNAKLQWDCTLDFNALTDAFFENYYKDAAEPMKDMFNYYRIWMAHLENDENIPPILSQNICTSRYWPKGTIDTLLGFIDRAYKAIEPLQESDPALYNTLYDRICLESIVYRKIDIEQYAAKYSSSELEEMKKQFRSDCTRMNVTRSSEQVDISSLWTNWGIA